VVSPQDQVLSSIAAKGAGALQAILRDHAGGFRLELDEAPKNDKLSNDKPNNDKGPNVNRRPFARLIKKQRENAPCG
jgi:hypothetical protein